MTRVLVVIPARGGSKGIPRKNLRLLAGQPLLAYGIRTALASAFAPDVFVSSDDEEILATARQLGARAMRRDGAIATDATTLDPVVHDALVRAEAELGVRYDLVVTLQPTSPLLRTASLDRALARFADDATLHTVIAARDDTHLAWTLRDGRFVPLYEKRVNRQFLPPTFRETGGFLVARRDVVTPAGRIGANVALEVLAGGEEIDIDTPEDWSLCEFHLARRRLLFVVAGNRQVGLGHVHNTLLLANDLVRHRIEFLVQADSQLAFEAIAARNYPVHRQASADLVDDIAALDPDVVVNDRLDTDADYVGRLKSLGVQVVNFEDLGPGARHADLVVNAIYPEGQALPRHYFGPDYFLLRDEFLLTPQPPVRERVGRVLLTFGGTDPNNLTRKVLAAVAGECAARGIAIEVIAGFGYEAFESLAGFEGVEIVRNVPDMAARMAAADLVFTSAGRTTYEIASLGVPCIVLAQNDRELTHLHASEANGFLHLGLGAATTAERILAAFLQLVDSEDERRARVERMRRTDLRGGRARVQALLADIAGAPARRRER